MLTQSKETRNAWRASQRTLDIKVTIDGKTYGATDINSLKYDSGAYNGDTFAIGSTYSNTVQIEFSHLVEGLKLGMEVHPSIGIKTSSGYVYEPLGVFIISSEIKMDRNNNLTTVSASDRFCGLEGAYVSKLTYPAKVLDVIAEICAQSGVKANADDLARLPHQADLPAPITGQSYRKALGWIAQLYVGYALFDRQGLFTIRTISEPNYELDPSQYEQGGLTKNEAAYKINGIQCQVTLTTKTRDGESTEETKTYQAGDATGSQIKLENNIMTPQRLNDIWEQLKDLTFYPFSLNWFGNPAVEAGDWLRLEDKQGNSFVVPNSSYTLDFNGGLSATSKADQTTSSDQMVPWQGSVAQVIKELQARRSPDGTVVFPPSVTAPPTNAKFNDVWFKKNGNSTELWIFEKQDDGSGKWIRKDLSDDEIKKKVADAQQGLNQAKADIINNKQKADQDIENLNKSIEVNKKKADQDIENLNKSIAANKKTADDSLQKLSDSITKLQGQYDNNIVPDLTKVTNDVADALQKYISAQNNIADLTKQAQAQGKNIADVTNTVKGLNINYSNLLGDVNSTKVDVKGMQTTLGNASGDIAQLKLDAQNLQTMLAGKVDNTTYTNFVNLTNQALAAKLTASDLNGYAKTADFQATADGLRAELNSVSGKFDNMVLGNRNLVRNSAFPKNKDFWEPTVDLSTHEYYYQGKKMLFVIKNQSSGEKVVGSAYFPVKRNTTYVFSFKGFMSVNVRDYDVWFLGRKYGETASSTSDIQLIKRERLSPSSHTDYVKDVVFNSGNNDEGYIRFDNNGSTDGKNSYFFFTEVKVEEGNKSTAWTAAPEDEQQRVDNIASELSAKIDVTNQHFSSYYTKSETDNRTNSAKNEAKNDAINAIKGDSKWTELTNIITNSGFLQSADGFVQKVQQTTVPMFNGGGVNLLLNTQNFDHNWAWDNIDHSYVKGVLTLSDANNGNSRMFQNVTGDSPIGKIVSVSFNARISADCNSKSVGIKVGPWDTLKSVAITSKDFQRYKVENWQWAGTLSTTFSFFVVGGKIDITDLKLEYGSVATPYSPNPADLATQISFSELSQLLDGLRSTVGSNYGSLQSQISQSSSAVRTDLIDKINGVQNQITTTADGLNAKIGAIQIGGVNLIQNGDANAYNATPWPHTQFQNHIFYHRGTKKMFNLHTASKNELVADNDRWFPIEAGQQYTLSFKGFMSGNVVSYDVWLLGKKIGVDEGWTNSFPIISWQRLSNGHCETITKTFTAPSDWNNFEAYLRFDNNGSSDGNDSVFFFNEVKLEKGNKATSYSPAPESTDKAFIELNATLNGLKSTVSGNYGQLQNTISQTNQATRNELINKITGVENTTTLTANSLNSVIGRIGSLEHLTSVQVVNNAINANDYTTTGTYFVQSTSSSNVPATNCFYLEVKKVDNGRIMQIWQADSDPTLRYVRTKFSDSWTQWQRSASYSEYSELNRTVQGLQSTVSSHYSTLTNQITQTSKTTRDEITDKVSGLQNQFTATADGLNAKIAGIRVGGRNLIQNSNASIERAIAWVNTAFRTHNYYYEGTRKMFLLHTSSANEITSGSNWFKLTPGEQYTLSFQGFMSANVINYDVWLLLRHSGDSGSRSATYQVIQAESLSSNYCQKVVKTFTAPSGYDEAYIRFDNNGSTDGKNSYFFFNEIKLEEGTIPTDWSPAPEDTEQAFTEVNATINGLQSTVSSNHSDLQSQISQTAKTIRQEVSDKTSGLQTQINQQANNFNVSLNSLRKETAWQKVTSAIDANNYKTTGNYWIQAAPNSNTPDSSAWAYLQVVAYPDVKRIKQTWQRDNNENEIYTRLLIGNNWTSWQRTVTGGNIMAQINMSAGTTLIQNDKIYMDASSTIFSGNAFIPSAAITSLNADKITAGTINGAKVNVINLNANNITAGTLRGSNGEFYLDSGSLHVWQNNHDAWIDQNGIHDYDNQRSVWIQKGEINFEHQLGGSMKHTGVILTNSENSNLNGAITIKGDEGFLLSTKNFTTNYWSEQGFSWGTNTAHYVSGSGILGFNNNITVSAGSTDDHSIAALIAGAIPSKNLGNIFGARAQPGVYIYGRNDSNKDHSFVDIKAPASIHLTTLDSYITIGDTTGYERNSDVSINSGNYLTVSADNSINITACSKTKAGLMPRISLSEASTSISGDSITLNAKNYVTLLGSSVSVTGDFGVLGKKNAIVPTSRGMAAINAYETAEYYFGDIGETQTNSNGVVTVMIDPYFLETVNTLVPYQVFLTSYGDGNVWVSSRSANNFTVKSSNPNIHFAWEIKAKRKGYENDRMKIVKGVFNNEQY